MFRLLLLNSVLLSFFCGFAQTPYQEWGGPVEIEMFDHSDYKGATQNWAIAQNSQGFIYAANTNGILEYDGKSWRLINSIPSKSTRSLAIDEDDHIFIGGAEALGCLIPNEKGAFIWHSLNHLLPDSMESFGAVWNTLTLNDQVFFGTQKKLFQFDASQLFDEKGAIDSTYSPKIHSNSTDNSQLITYFIWNQRLYVFEKNVGIKVLEGDSLKSYFTDQAFIEDKERVVNMLPYGDLNNPDPDTALMYTLNGNFYLLHKNGMRPFPMDEKAKEYVGKGIFTNAIQLNDGAYAFSNRTGKGLVVMDRDGNVKYSIKDGLGAGIVYDVIQDHEDNLWLGMSDGIARVGLPEPVSSLGEDNGINSEVYAITRYEGDLYAGSTVGLFKLNPAKQPGDKAQFERVHEEIFQVFGLINANETLLISCGNGIFSLKNNQLTKLHTSSSYFFHPSSFSPDIIFVNLLEGVGILGRHNGTWRFLGYFPIKLPLAPSFEYIGEGKYLLPSFQGKMIQINAPTLKNLLMNNGPDEIKNQLSDIKIDTIHIKIPPGIAAAEMLGFRIKDKLYFGTCMGLRTWDSATQNLKLDATLGKVFADSTRTIFGIYDGPEDQIWIFGTKEGRGEVHRRMLTPSGEYKWESKSLLGTIFDRDISTIYVDPINPSITWMGFPQGVLRLDSRIEKNFAPSYDAHIRKLIANGDTTLFLGKDLDNEKADVEIDYELNSLRFEYAATTYEEAHQLLFQLYLEGFDEQWSSWTQEAKKDYTRIPPGTYTFHVKAKNAFQEISQEDHYTFTILPPWYMTWWAYGVYIFLGIFTILLLVIGFSKWRLRQLEARNEQLEVIVEERTQEVLAIQEQLLVQEKMASLGQMTAGIAHEIKNPLNFVNNFARNVKQLAGEISEELQEAKDKFDEREYEDLQGMLGMMESGSQSIEKNGKRANEIVSSMMLHMGTSTGESRPTNLNQLLSEYASLAYHGFMAQGFEEEIAIRENLDDSIAPISVIPQELSRAFLNIFTNACEAVQERIGEPGFQPQIEFSTQQEERDVVIRIKDNGKGISKTAQAKLFEPFYTTKPTGKGNIGLGLSIAYNIIVSRHKGTIEVESEDGQGSEFIIRLPR